MIFRIIYLTVFFGATGAVFNFNNFDRLNVKFYHGTDSRIFTQYHLSNITQLLTNKYFDHSRPTTLYIFGWLQNPLGDSTRQLIDAYVQRGDYNFLVLDWSNYNVDLYTIVMFRMSKMSRVVGRSMTKLFNKGLSTQTFHCVGHSFGAHSCGIIGREVQESSKGRYKMARITGLDPAKWKFFPAVYENPLGRNDATFVDTIQTDNFFVGAIVPLGHASFYPNNAEVQPGCPPLRTNSFYNFLSSWCSHFNANRYWTESLKRSHTYPAVKCSNWKDYKNGQCNHNPVNFMGLGASANITGVFYIELKTNTIFNHDEFYYYILSRIGERVIDVIVNELGIRL